MASTGGWRPSFTYDRSHRPARPGPYGLTLALILPGGGYALTRGLDLWTLLLLGGAVVMAVVLSVREWRRGR